GSVSGGDGQQFSSAPIVFAGEQNSNPATPPNPDSVTIGVTVGQSGFTFTPSTAKILPGDTVTWTFLGSNHTVSSGVPCTVDNQYCSPSNMSCASSPTNTLNSTYSHIFNQVGASPYFCRVHCGFGMTGTVQVIMPAITTATRATDGHFTAAGTSAANRGATVRSTPDLLTAFGNPQSITTDSTGVFQFDDTSVPTATAQFYEVTFP
ncbi:MAG: plastocyanin/azurin family copper-binding protein, partial [Verrucomicrobiota bacterium]|nr:plastocyanin/azurin family copper-binding protein [Verrucomicrobiota bacterium]